MAFIFSGVTATLQRHGLEVRGAKAFAATLADGGRVVWAVMVVAGFPVGRRCRYGGRQRIVECHVKVFLWARQEEDSPHAAFRVIANLIVGVLRLIAGKRTRSIPHWRPRRGLVGFFGFPARLDAWRIMIYYTLQGALRRARPRNSA